MSPRTTRGKGRGGRALRWAFAALALGVLACTASAAVPDRRPPGIVSARLLDRDGDFRADAVRLVYSERVRHALDRDGRYPFSVAGYRIRTAGAARGATLILALAEKAYPDDTARPSIRYRRTTSKPVRDRAGNQARAQLFRAAKPHAHAPPVVVPPEPPPPPPPPNPTLPPDTDPDRDGYSAPDDCAPNDAAVHPGAPDLPDLSFLDSNCDGIDGTEAKAVFAAPDGNDANPGTKDRPKREIRAAVLAAAASGRYVLAAGGTYGHVDAKSGVGIYGGYARAGWSRGASVTSITGAPEGILADAAKGVVLQLLSVTGTNDGEAERSAYGIRAVNGSQLSLQRVTVAAGNGATGAAGAPGRPGLDAENGKPGADGSCDLEKNPAFDFGGAGGDSPVARHGGKGGDSGYGTGSGKDGDPGRFGTPGGKGGKGGDPGKAGTNGGDGTDGAPGLGGDGGTASLAAAGAVWIGRSGASGRFGGTGNGGGGGGGGGGQGGFFVDDGTGNGGGGGGGGGGPGWPGDGAGFGGGSFGVYLHNSTLEASASSIAAGSGGAGGRGGPGGPGGKGGAGGEGARDCTSEVGAGGNGGHGGAGGDGGGGGGGAGGPGIGVMKLGSSTATLTETAVTFGQPGSGGERGAGGPPGTPSQAGIAQAVYP